MLAWESDSSSVPSAEREFFVCSSNQGALPARVASFLNWTGHAAAAPNNSLGRATQTRANCSISEKYFDKMLPKNTLAKYFEQFVQYAQIIQFV